MQLYAEGIYDGVEIIEQGFKPAATGSTGFYIKIAPDIEVRTIAWWIKPDDDGSAIDRMLEDLEAMGLPIGDVSRFSQLDPRSADHVSFVGLTVTLRCVHEPDKKDPTKTWDRFKAVRPEKTKEPTVPADQAAIRKLDALFGKKLKGKAKPATVQPTTPKGKPLSADAGQDDPSGIPF